MIQVGYAVAWWAVVVFVGVIAFPLVSRVCGGLQDKGYSISKLLALLLVTYFTWLLASIHALKFGYLNIAVSLVLLLLLCLFLGRRNLDVRRWPLRAMLVSEALFAACYALFLLFLYYKPDVFFAYSEDFMNYGFYQSVLRADYFPPGDPWLAGQTLPYYYGGHLLVAILTKISTVPPSIAYNLAVAMFFGLAVAAAYGLGYNATRRKLYGFVAALFVCVLGFISGAFQLASYLTGQEVLHHGARAGQGFLDWLLTYDLGAQVIPDTGNSYPYYAFLQGELHAHTVSIPFQLMVLTLLFSLSKERDPAAGTYRWDSVVNVAVIGVSLGFISFVNSWDYPTYIVLTLLAFLLLRLSVNWKGLAAALALSAILFLPYYLTRGTVGLHGVGLVTDRTLLVQFIELFALFLFALFSLVYLLTRPGLFRGRAFMAALIVVIAAALGGFLGHFELLLLLVPLILASLYGIWKSRPRKDSDFMLLLVLTGALVVLFCEIFYIDDALSAPNERFNTVMKFYLEVWVLWGIASAYAVYWVLRSTRGVAKAVWLVLLGLLVVASVIQPIGLTAGWSSGRQTVFGMNRGTLDGLAYLQAFDPGDYAAIEWIGRNIQGHPTMLEAPGGAYQYTSRIATMTGLPTVIGWVTHEVMWRGSWDRIAGRDSDVDTIYTTTGNAQAMDLLKKYNVEYIYVGGIEEEKYPRDGLQKFADHPETYEPVYDAEGVTIYRVLP